MRYTVERIQHPQYSNELLPMLIDKDDYRSPEPSAALWGWNLWLSNPYNTVRSRLEDLCIFYEFIDSEYPEFFSDAAKLKLINSRTLNALVSFLLINFRQGKDSGVSVKPSTFNRRLDSVISFVDFHYSRYIDRVVDVGEMDSHRRSLQRLCKQIGKKRYKSSEVENETSYSEPLSEEEIELIRLIVRPSTEEFINEVNPFRKRLQLRNVCLIEMIYELGCRASELILIRANDQDLKLTSKPTVVIQAPSVNDAGSRGRSDGASHKTLNRELPITQGLANLLVEYLENDRPLLRKKSSNKSRTPYLFVSEKDGGAMTTDGLDYVISALFNKFPDLKNEIHPHRFRVTRGNELREAVDDEYKGSNSPMIKAGDMQDTLTAWGGWSSTSQMPRRYTSAHIQRKINDYLVGKD